MDVLNRLDCAGQLTTPRVPLSKHAHNLSLTFFLLALVFTGGCVADLHAQEPSSSPPLEVPPLPKRLQHGQELLEFYPNRSKWAHEQGRVVVNLQIGDSGALEQPMQIDRERTDATPRLEEAAQKILSFGGRFAVGDNYKKNVTVSIVFELPPCGTVKQDPTADHRINLCFYPSPYGTFDFEAHPPSAFEDQVRKVLIHGDLADIDFLEATLGLRFRVTRPVPSPYSYGHDRSLHVLVMPTLVPKTLRAQGLGYESRADTATNTSVFTLTLVPVECPDIGLWAARSNIPFDSSHNQHGGNGRSTAFQWGGEHGIKVTGAYGDGDSCNILLSQKKELREPFSSHTDSDLIPTAPLVEGIGAMIASGDIRDAALAERALHTSFTTSGPGEFGLSYELQDIIPGVDPAYFAYSVNDTGKEPNPLGAFVYQPLIAANRTATLRLTVDVYHLCIRRSQLASELHRRHVHYHWFVKDGVDIRVIRGQNEISVQSRVFGECVRNIDISQTTGVKHALHRSD